MKPLNDLLKDTIQREFREADWGAVRHELMSITLVHVMAASDYNLNNTRHAVLKLAKGDVDAVKKLTERAKFDFRDVILWAVQDT